MDWTNTENVRENMQESCQLVSIYKHIGMLGAVSRQNVIITMGYGLFQNPLTTPFWSFLSKVLCEAKRQKIVTV